VIELWHDWNSAHSFKVRVMLAEKSLIWTDREVELLKFEHLRPEYLTLNSNGVVPTLVHDGRTVLESSIICEYLEEAFPVPAMLPALPYDRAKARLWLKHFDAVVHPAMRKASFELLYKPMLSRMPKAELVQRVSTHPDPNRAQAFINASEASTDLGVVRDAMADFTATISLIEAALKDWPWLTGPEFGIADGAMAVLAERLENLRMRSLWKGKPRALDWTGRVLSRESVLQARAPAIKRFPTPSGEDFQW
jgi:glutathione S-transferase